MKRRWVLIVAVGVAAIVAIASYGASLRLSESLYSTRGSFAYWLTISSVIKGVPAVDAVDGPRFYSSAGDGPKLPESAVTYRSRAPSEDIAQKLDAYFRAAGYSKQSDGSYQRGMSIVSVEIVAESLENRVRVKETY
jgi:hypothetical protein